MILRTKYIYTFSSLFVVSWWLLAFHRPVAYEGVVPEETTNQQTLTTTPLDSIDSVNLLQIDRAKVKKALDGDVSLMGQLIAEWDLDAEIEGNRSGTTLKRLKRDEFLRAQLLSKTLLTQDRIAINLLRENHRHQLLIDDKGYPFDLTHPPETFLPQTYLAAGILLSLVSPSDLVALPRGMRQQTAIYPQELTDLIPHDIDSFHMEQLYAYRPDIALISERYTHPLTLEALESQGIPKYHLPEVQSIEDIEELIRSLGQLCNRPLKAELMALFLKAGVMAIDNEREVSLRNKSPEKVLVLNYLSRFSLPGKNTLTKHMINRMNLDSINQIQKGLVEDSWSTPISEEMIVHINPQKLMIITSSDAQQVKDYFYQTTLFKHIEAAQTNKVAILDDSIQQTISQYILLAYYDLNRSLVDLYAE